MFHTNLLLRLFPKKEIEGSFYTWTFSGTPLHFCTSVTCNVQGTMAPVFSLEDISGNSWKREQPSHEYVCITQRTGQNLHSFFGARTPTCSLSAPTRLVSETIQTNELHCLHRAERAALFMRRCSVCVAVITSGKHFLKAPCTDTELLRSRSEFTPLSKASTENFEEPMMFWKRVQMKWFCSLLLHKI